MQQCSSGDHDQKDIPISHHAHDQKEVHNKCESESCKAEDMQATNATTSSPLGAATLEVCFSKNTCSLLDIGCNHFPQICKHSAYNSFGSDLLYKFRVDLTM